MKLELEHIAQLAANKYKCHAMGKHIIGTEFDDNPIPKIFIISGFSREEDDEILVQLYDIEEKIQELYPIQDVFPIAHPLSDLTKEGEYNGGTIVPIKKLLDIATECNWSNTDYIETNGNRYECWVRFKDAPSSAFGYNFDSKFFYRETECGQRHVLHQGELFKQLYKWKFDVDGLIEQGLAVDINSLK